MWCVYKYKNCEAMRNFVQIIFCTIFCENLQVLFWCELIKVLKKIKQTFIFMVNQYIEIIINQEVWMLMMQSTNIVRA